MQFLLLCNSTGSRIQNRHQKLNGTVAGLTHDRRVDRETVLLMTQLKDAAAFAYWSLRQLVSPGLTS